MKCVRLAAVGDVHVGLDSGAVLHSELLVEAADLLLVAGDLTRHGTPAEADRFAAEVATVPVPVVVVLGNHDFESDAAEEVRTVVESAGATVLDGGSVEVDLGGVRVGIAGTPGFGGGFRGASCSEFGEPLMKAFVRHSRTMADALCDSLKRLETDLRIALTHYSPIEATLDGERREIYPFLGSYPRACFHIDRTRCVRFLRAGRAARRRDRRASRGDHRGRTPALGRCAPGGTSGRAVHRRPDPPLCLGHSAGVGRLGRRDSLGQYTGESDVHGRTTISRPMGSGPVAALCSRRRTVATWIKERICRRSHLVPGRALAAHMQSLGLGGGDVEALSEEVARVLLAAVALVVSVTMQVVGAAPVAASSPSGSTVTWRSIDPPENGDVAGAQWIEIDVPVPSMLDRRILAAIFHRKGEAPFPVVVYLHGGSGRGDGHAAVGTAPE